MANIEIESEVAGNVWKIEKAVGDQVEQDDIIMILESMKMEIPIESPAAGKLSAINVKVDDQVEEDQVVASIEIASDP